MKSHQKEVRKILNSSIRLRRDIEQSGNDLWSILKKEKKNLHEWQQVVTQILLQLYNKIKNIEDKNHEDKKFTLVIFGNSIAKLIVPKNTIKCDELVTTHKVVRK